MAVHHIQLDVVEEVGSCREPRGPHYRSGSHAALLDGIGQIAIARQSVKEVACRVKRHRYNAKPAIVRGVHEEIAVRPLFQLNAHSCVSLPVHGAGIRSTPELLSWSHNRSIGAVIRHLDNGRRVQPANVKLFWLSMVTGPGLLYEPRTVTAPSPVHHQNLVAHALLTRTLPSL